MKKEKAIMKNTGKTDLDHLRNLEDNKIDYSDIPATTQEFWEDAEVFYPGKRVRVSFEIDEDIAIWLKSLGAKSDKAVNSLLRSFYLSMKSLR